MTPILDFNPCYGSDNNGRKISDYQSGLWYIGSDFFSDGPLTLIVNFESPDVTYQWFYE